MWLEFTDSFRDTPLKYVPEDLKTYELCKQAIEHSAGGGAIGYVPVEILYEHPDLTLFAIKKDPTNIEFIPDELKTRKVCIAAVNKSHAMINYCPMSIIKEAVSQHPAIYTYLKDENKTLELSKIFMSKMPKTVDYNGFNKNWQFVPYPQHNEIEAWMKNNEIT